MTKKLFITDPRQLLKALAQVIEDHPEVHTHDEYAVTKSGLAVLPESKDACKFCAIAMMRRLMAEGTTDISVACKARDYFLIKNSMNISRANDSKFRDDFVYMLRKAAA